MRVTYGPTKEREAGRELGEVAQRGRETSEIRTDRNLDDAVSHFLMLLVLYSVKVLNFLTFVSFLFRYDTSSQAPS